MIVTNNNIPINDLATIKTNKPSDAKTYWVPYNHFELLNRILQEIQQNKGWVTPSSNNINPITINLNRDKTNMTACIPINSVHPTYLNFVPCLGIINSNSMKSSLKIYIGFTCNACGFVICNPLRMKHTSKLDDRKIQDIIKYFAQKTTTIITFITKLQKHKLSAIEVTSLVTHAGRRKVMAWSRIGKVIEILNKLHKVKNTSKRAWNAWEVLVAFSGVTQLSPPFNQMEMLNKFRKILSREENNVCNKTLNIS